MGSSRVRRDPATSLKDSAGSAAATKSSASSSQGPAAAPESARRVAANGGGNRSQPPLDLDGSGSPASRRVLRSQGRRTMRKLLDAAMVAFDQRGYHATRVNDIVDIAKTSHGTFYLYFSNKEDVLRALVTEAAVESQSLRDALNTLPAEGGAAQWDDVHRWVKAFSDLWQRYAPIFRAWTDLATIDPEVVDIIRGTFTALSQALSNQFSPDSSGHVIDPEVAGMAVLAMLDRFHYFLEFSDKPIDDVALRTMTTMVYRAFLDPNASLPTAT